MRARLRVLRQLLSLAFSRGSWWLAPVMIGLVFVAVLAIAGAATPLSPFIYPLF